MDDDEDEYDSSQADDDSDEDEYDSSDTDDDSDEDEYDSSDTYDDEDEYESNPIINVELINQQYIPFHSPQYAIYFNFRFDFRNSKGHNYFSTRESALALQDDTASTYFQALEAVDELLARVEHLVRVSDYQRQRLKEFAWAEASRNIRRAKFYPGNYAVDLEILVQVQHRHVFGPSQTSCSCICLEDFKSLMRLPCSHVFHGDCIRKWLRTSPYCPICGFEMPPPPPPPAAA